jgi:hypothetical protein
MWNTGREIKILEPLKVHLRHLIFLDRKKRVLRFKKKLDKFGVVYTNDGNFMFHAFRRAKPCL